jgi:hypothetical protein
MTGPTRIADYLDAIQYRQYSRSLLQERRRMLAFALFCGDDDWLLNEPIESVARTVRARFNVRSRRSLQRLEAAVEDYRRWRRQLEQGASHDGA